MGDGRVSSTRPRQTATRDHPIRRSATRPVSLLTRSKFVCAERDATLLISVDQPGSYPEPPGPPAPAACFDVSPTQDLVRRMRSKVLMRSRVAASDPSATSRLDQARADRPGPPAGAGGLTPPGRPTVCRAHGQPPRADAHPGAWWAKNSCTPPSPTTPSRRQGHPRSPRTSAAAFRLGARHAAMVARPRDAAPSDHRLHHHECYSLVCRPSSSIPAGCAHGG